MVRIVLSPQRAKWRLAQAHDERGISRQTVVRGSLVFSGTPGFPARSVLKEGAKSVQSPAHRAAGVKAQIHSGLCNWRRQSLYRRDDAMAWELRKICLSMGLHKALV